MFDRRSRGLFSNWWWTIDRLTFGAILLIALFSAVMVATTSPAVAERIGLEPYYFIKRQIIYLGLSMIIIFFISIIDAKMIKYLSLAGLFFCFFTLILVLLFGQEVKGAKRWISFVGFSLQPSEFVKPFFVVMVGWVLSMQYKVNNFPSFKIVALIYFILIGLIILQPDFGMAITISAVWAGQLFLAGLHMAWVISFAILAITGITCAYLFLPHVQHRINNFIDPSVGDNYQIKKSLSALMNGGITGRGPGEGTVKQYLPDSHTDFIFAVIGEELGLLACLIVMSLFAFIIFRGLIRISSNNDIFTMLAVSGLLMQFGFQAIINMGVTMHLFPTKGMTLPFISYGGSSMMAVSISMGMILSLTRKKYGIKNSKRFID